MLLGRTNSGSRAQSGAMLRDKGLDPQSLRDDIDSLSQRVKDLEKQVEELRDARKLK